MPVILIILCVIGYMLIGVLASLVVVNEINGVILFFWPLFALLGIVEQIIFWIIKTVQRHGGKL